MKRLTLNRKIINEKHKIVLPSDLPLPYTNTGDMFTVYKDNGCVGLLVKKKYLRTLVNEFELNIDVELLRKQKNAILEIANHVDSFKDEIQGVISLLDEIQDQLVDKHNINENDVFNL